MAIILAKFREAVNYMGMLLDLRHKSKRPYHKDELVIIVEHVTDLVLMHDLNRVRAAAATTEAESGEGRGEGGVVRGEENTLEHPISNDLLPDTGRALERLLQKIMTSCHNEPDMWEICAGFYGKLRRHRFVHSHIARPPLLSISHKLIYPDSDPDLNPLPMPYARA